MTMKNDAKFEEKLICCFKFDIRNLRKIDPRTRKSQRLAHAIKNDMRNLANFYRLKNSDFILENKMDELNQNKNSKQQIN